MKQKKITLMADALDLSTTAIAGATDMGVAGPKYNTAAVLTADSAALVTARNVHDAALMELDRKQDVLNTVRLSARVFAIMAKDRLKLRLGSKYSQAWDVAGFVGSLRVPSSTSDLKVLLQRLVSYFTNEPTAESAEVTATAAQTLYGELVAAENAINAQKTVVNTKLNDRKAKFDVVKRRIRGLVKELSEILDPLDPRWTSFGLNKPGAKQMPGVPENVTVTLIGGGKAVVSWGSAPRAEHYRLWMKINGVDEELQSVGSSAGVDFTIEGLPANATIEIAVSAVNNGGESGKSAVVTVSTH